MKSINIRRYANYASAIVGAMMLFSSCDDVFEPAAEFNRSLTELTADPTAYQGILGYAYNQIPCLTQSYTDVATDDAVSNELDNTYRSMATGSWTAVSNPLDIWQKCYASIQYLNIFMENLSEVEFAEDTVANRLFQNRMRGEALTLRALNYYYLLRYYGGESSDGELLGVPLYTKSVSSNDDYNTPRASYADCVALIKQDVSDACKLLPTTYGDVSSDNDIPSALQSGDVDFSQYNRVYGTLARGLADATVARSVWAMTALLASSPAYSASGTTSEEAANAAAEVLDLVGGPSGLDPNGNTWYMQTTAIDDLGAGANLPEIIFRADRDNGTDTYALGLQQERDNFPPSLYGNGRINPSQNLVDAFPMADGYPINHDRSSYLSTKPYQNRDPRLAAYIIYNGATYKDTEIITGSYGTTNDALNRESEHSTRTGYYMRKLLREDCNPNTQYNQAQYHLPVYIRYTEIFLDYAEAANEAWGPTGTGSHDYSAYDVIKAIRQRAGIEGDNYLESIKNDQSSMRTLIRNERRLELCFENHRFWDLRRWQQSLNETVQGISISMQDDGNLEYSVIDVETRAYKDYMNIAPLPNTEILKFSALKQNKGW